MSRTWFLGDVHGCAEELSALLEQIALGPDDRLVSLGDLYHRGPDPLGVARQLAALSRFELVLGNHERAMVRGGDLRGDGRTPLAEVAESDAHELLTLLEERPYWLRGEAEGQDWIAVHAGLVPGSRVEDTPVEQLIRLRRLRRLPGAPYWYEVWNGPELVFFGHTPSKMPRTRFAGGRLVALGLDTGCVYGGALTAYCAEDGEIARVDARRAWARA